MRHTSTILFGVCAAAAVLVAAPAVLAAETAPAPTVTYYGDPAVPDISGLWLGSSTGVPGNHPKTPDGRSQTYWAPWPPPLTPDYQKMADGRIAAAKAGRALGDSSARCLPFGIFVALTANNYPNEIMQTPGEVTFLIFDTFPIVVWTDGRGHPKDLKPSYNGHSIGHWVGDTLFVDTVGLNDSTAIDQTQRTPHSGDAHLVWTVQKVAKDDLHFHFTLYDDKALTEPMTTTNIWQRKSGAEWQMLDDASCFENNLNKPDEAGAPGFLTF